MKSEPLRIGLHDAEMDHMKRKNFPNLALMKLSAYHKAQGDTVEWWVPMITYDKVYSSKVFDFTPENPYLPPDTIRGGTGYRDIPLIHKLPDDVENCYPDYSIYPQCDYAIGYLTRGCPRKCPWCVVPEKEGNITPYRTWQEVVRQDTKKLTLLDNNILACQYGIEQLTELGGTKYRLDLNQGMDARLVTPDVAKILSKLKWQEYIRFSCDTADQLESIDNVVELLNKNGVKTYRVFVYLLVTKDIDNAAKRVEHLKKHGSIAIYAQPERNEAKGIVPNEIQKEFAQRYIYGHSFRKETWQEYQETRKNTLPWLKGV